MSIRQMHVRLLVPARRVVVACQHTILAQCQTRIPSQIYRHTLTTSVPSCYPRTPFGTRPSPPLLPPEEQKEFEELVRKTQMPLVGTGASLMIIEKAFRIVLTSICRPVTRSKYTSVSNIIHHTRLVLPHPLCLWSHIGILAKSSRVQYFRILGADKFSL